MAVSDMITYIGSLRVRGRTPIFFVKSDPPAGIFFSVASWLLLGDAGCCSAMLTAARRCWLLLSRGGCSAMMASAQRRLLLSDGGCSVAAAAARRQQLLLGDWLLLLQTLRGGHIGSSRLYRPVRVRELAFTPKESRDREPNNTLQTSLVTPWQHTVRYALTHTLMPLTFVRMFRVMLSTTHKFRYPLAPSHAA